jgi:hypothetical protein
MNDKVDKLAKLREPFAAHLISKLPKETKSQREGREANRSLGISCPICGGWHHKDAIHLDYVGHAALTDRLLDVDPLWYWEPVAFGEDGLPRFDKTGGLWIRLHVCGHSRLGYGHAKAATYQDIGAREKEVIGDALRNAAMRFGAALDLWHKGDLHADDDEPKVEQRAQSTPTAQMQDDLHAFDEATRNTMVEYATMWHRAFAFDKAEAYRIYRAGMDDMVGDATAQSALKGLCTKEEKAAFVAILRQSQMKPELPQPRDAARFAESFKKWAALIESGTKTHDEIIAFAESKAPLTDGQKKQILVIKPPTKGKAPESAKKESA